MSRRGPWPRRGLRLALGIAALQVLPWLAAPTSWAQTTQVETAATATSAPSTDTTTDTTAAKPSHGPIVLRDDRGRELRLAAPPRRIVSMLPSLTEAAWVLGAGDRLVGIDRYTDWPPEVLRLPRLGGLEDAQIEGIVALRPTS